MKKNLFVFVVFLLLGLLAGSLAGHLLEPVRSLQWLTNSSLIDWNPKADLGFLKYDCNFQVKLSLLNLIGAAAAILLYRKV